MLRPPSASSVTPKIAEQLLGYATVAVATLREVSDLNNAPFLESICARLYVDYKGVFPPAMLSNIGQFGESLQKIQSFMRPQKDQGKIKRLINNRENTVQ
ncbi:hypothetical protein B0H19DRAFT_1252797 [Mycena capillaripes]|nr:hypothetical protein B0H19DRAFT_1252797 [Mycena capillaripes]